MSPYRSYQVCMYLRILSSYHVPIFVHTQYAGLFAQIYIPCPHIRSYPVCRYVHLNLHTMSPYRSYQVCMYLLILSTYYVPIFVHTQYVGMLTSTYIPCPHIRTYQVCMYLRILSTYHVPIFVHAKCVCIFASYLHTMSPYSFIPRVYVSSHLIYIPCPHIRSYQVCRYFRLNLHTMSHLTFIPRVYVSSHLIYIPCPHIRSYQVCMYLRILSTYQVPIFVHTKCLCIFASYLHTMSPYSFIPSVYVSSHLIYIPCPRIRSYQVCMYLRILSTYHVPVFVHTKCVGMFSSIRFKVMFLY